MFVYCIFIRYYHLDIRMFLDHGWKQDLILRIFNLINVLNKCFKISFEMFKVFVHSLLLEIRL